MKNILFAIGQIHDLNYRIPYKSVIAPPHRYAPRRKAHLKKVMKPDRSIKHTYKVSMDTLSRRYALKKSFREQIGPGPLF